MRIGVQDRHIVKKFYSMPDHEGLLYPWRNNDWKFDTHIYKSGMPLRLSKCGMRAAVSIHVRWTMNWKKDKLIGKTTVIDGCKVSRVDCNSGVRHYYLDSVLLPNGKTKWLSAEKLSSLNQVRRQIKIIRDASDLMDLMKKTGDVWTTQD